GHAPARKGHEWKARRPRFWRPRTCNVGPTLGPASEPGQGERPNTSALVLPVAVHLFLHDPWPAIWIAHCFLGDPGDVAVHRIGDGDLRHAAADRAIAAVAGARYDGAQPQQAIAACDVADEGARFGREAVRPIVFLAAFDDLGAHGAAAQECAAAGGVIDEEDLAHTVAGNEEAYAEAFFRLFIRFQAEV